jgi:hypothetical protein
MPKQDTKLSMAFIAPEAIAGIFSALGVPVAAVFGNLLLVALLTFIAFGIFLRFKRRRTIRTISARKG